MDMNTEAALREQLAQTEERLRQAEENVRTARADQRRQALSDMGGASELMRMAEADEQRAQTEYDSAEKAVNGTVYHGMEPEEAQRRTDKDYKAAKELLKLAKKLPPAKLAFIPLGLCVPAFLLALILPWKLPCVGVGSILLLLFVVSWPRLRELEHTKAETLATRQKILDAYGAEDPEEMPGILRDYRRLWQERETARVRLEDAKKVRDGAKLVRDKIGSAAVGTLDFVNGSSAAAQAGRRLKELQAERDELKARLDAIGGEPAQP